MEEISKDNPSVQIEISIIPKNEGKKNKDQPKKF